MRHAASVALPFLTGILAHAADTDDRRMTLRGPIANERQAVAALFTHELKEERLLSKEKLQVKRMAKVNAKLAMNLAKCKKSRARRLDRTETACEGRSQQLRRSLGLCSAQRDKYGSQLRYVLSELNQFNARRTALDRDSQNSHASLKKWQRLVRNLTNAYHHEEVRLSSDEESLSKKHHWEEQLNKALERSEDQVRSDRRIEVQLHQALKSAEVFRQNATAQMLAQDHHIRTLSHAYVLEKRVRSAAQAKAQDASVKASALEKAYEQLGRHERELQMKLHSMGQTLNREQHLRSEHASELNALKQTLAAKEAQLRSLDSKLKGAQQQLTSIRSEYTNTENKVKSLSDESSEAQKLIKKDADLLSRCHSHAKQLKQDLESEFKKQLLFIKRENSNLTALNTALTLNLSHQLEHEKALEKNLTSRIEALQHKNLDLTVHIEAARVNLSAEAAVIRRTEREREKLEARDNAVVAVLTSSKAEAEVLLTDTAKFVAMRRKKHELAKKREKAFKEELGSLRVANRTLSQQGQVLKHKLEQEDAANNLLVKEKEALADEVRKHKAVQESMKEHEKALLNNFSEQFSVLHTQNHALAAKLEADVSVKSGREKKLLADNAALQNESLALGRQIKELQHGYAKKYSDMEKENDGWFKQSQDMQAKLKSDEAKLADEVMVEKALNQKLDAARKATEEEKMHNKDLKDRLGKANDEMSHHDALEKELQGQFEKLKTQLKSTEARTDQFSRTRSVLTAALFHALDANGDTRLDGKELDVFGKLTGFQGEPDEWLKQYRILCHDRGVNPSAGFEEAQFREMVDDESEVSTHCSDEELAELLGKVSVAAVRPEVLALIHHGRPVTTKRAVGHTVKTVLDAERRGSGGGPA